MANLSSTAMNGVTVIDLFKNTQDQFDYRIESVDYRWVICG